VITDGTGKMTDETEAKETGEMEETPRIAEEKTADGITTMTERTGEILHENKISGTLRDTHKMRKVHTTVQLQRPSSLDRFQNKIIKWVCEISMNLSPY
jgi:hypothetical protein